ncbi:MAG: hypothetical protein V2A54_18225 [Bacteroidota bacterium]
MKKHMRPLLALLFCSVVLGCTNRKATSNVLPIKPDSLAWEVGFGFSNQDGSECKLILDESSTLDPALYTHTILSDGKLGEIKFIEKKNPNEKDNGREAAHNFINHGGYLYQIASGNLNKHVTTLFMTHRYFSTRTQILFTKNETATLPQNLKKQIETEKGRKVKEARELAALGKQRFVYIVEFETKNDSSLASLVLSNSKERLYYDYSAKYDLQSTWRVDDQGRFGVEYYSIIAAFESPDGIELFTDWIGEEGFTVELIKQNKNNFQSVKKGYRYTAPL